MTDSERSNFEVKFYPEGNLVAIGSLVKFCSELVKSVKCDKTFERLVLKY